jgi:hypothetical protein
MSGIEDKVEGIRHSDSTIEKNKHNYNFQELWGMIKIPKLKIHGRESRPGIQTKRIRKIFNEIMPEIFQKL